MASWTIHVLVDPIHLEECFVKTSLNALLIGLACVVFLLHPNPIDALQVTTNDSEAKNRLAAKPKFPGITISSVQNKKVQVLVDGELFTTFDYGTYAKPILYPILGPGQIGMTRNWPMKEGKAESHDHPHHKSMWISHEIDGVDFWSEKGGSVRTKIFESGEKSFGEKNAFRATSLWIRKDDGKTMLTDRTTYRFGVDKASRWIDCTITFEASHGDFQFDDTKEGLFAIRMHPDLRLTPNPRKGVTEVFGSALNSVGEAGKDIWGKPAKWVLYQGPIDGTPMSIAIYDHSTNFRHPTTWHARDYGLLAANPFGMHYFLGKAKGAGAYVLKSRDSLTLRYRAEFIRGIATANDIENRYQVFVDQRSEN